MKKFTKFFIGLFNFSLIRNNTLEALQSRQTQSERRADIEFTLAFGGKFGDRLFELLSKSRSQFKQDLFVISEVDFKSNGYFVEFGATDGITFSNTYLLEKEFGFNGILAEPNPNMWKNIAKVRDVFIETECVWSKSGEIIDFVDSGGKSTISRFLHADMHAGKRRSNNIFKIKTISLTDMLEKYGAPNLIDYLSIDTEGSEFEILQAHDFNKFKFKIITVEHNYSNQRQKIYDLLTSYGYKRKYEFISGVDDWYILDN